MAERIVTLTPDEEAVLRKVVGPVPGVEHLFRDVQVQAKKDPRVADIHTVPPEVDFLTTRIPPPAAFYLAREDQLRIGLWNSVANATVFMGARFLLPNGRLIPWVEQFTPAATRAEVVTLLPPVEGYLLGLQFGTTTVTQPGQCYVTAMINRPKAPTGSELHTLVAGYVTTAIRPSWPASQPRDPRDGQGAIRVILGTTPAVGTDLLETVVTGARWKLRSWVAQLTTSATAVNRRAHLVVDDGTNTLLNFPSTTVMAGSAVSDVGWADGLGASTPSADAAGFDMFPTGYLLLPGWRIRTLTTGLQGGDQWGRPRYVIEEWIDQ